MEWIKVTCIALIALMACYQAEAISCYVGIGAGGISESSKVAGCTTCQKISADVSGLGGLGGLADSAVRSCVTNTTCTPSSIGVGGVSEGTYCCNTELCNGSTTVYISSLLSIGALLVLALRGVDIL